MSAARRDGPPVQYRPAPARATACPRLAKTWTTPRSRGTVQRERWRNHLAVREFTISDGKDFFFGFKQVLCTCPIWYGISKTKNMTRVTPVGDRRLGLERRLRCSRGGARREKSGLAESLTRTNRLTHRFCVAAAKAVEISRLPDTPPRTASQAIELLFLFGSELCGDIASQLYVKGSQLVFWRTLGKDQLPDRGWIRLG